MNVASGTPSASADVNDLIEVAPRRMRLGRGHAGRLSLVVVVLAVLSGLATYVVLTGLTPVKPTRNLIIGLLIINALLVATLATIIGLQLWDLFDARRRRIAGAGLHIRLVGLLALCSIVPALIVAIFASVTLNRGLDAWFSQRTQSIVETAVTVAQAYISEQTEVVRADVGFIANDLNQQKTMFDSEHQRFVRRLATMAALRGLSGAFVFDAGKKRVEASATASRQVDFRPPDQSQIDAAAKGEMVVVGPGDGNVIRGLVKLPNFDNHFLYIYRLVDPDVIAQLSKAREEKAEYDRLLQQRAGVQVTFALMYAGVTFIFLLAAIWLGLWFADRLVSPVVGLVHASRRVSRGEFDAKVPVDTSTGDLATLGKTFNQMTDQLQAQRDELMAANYTLDERRRFTEAVLSGVSAGVVGLDAEGRIDLANRSAQRLLRLRPQQLVGRPLGEIVEPMEAVFRQALTKVSGLAEAQVKVRIADEDRTFHVRVTKEQASETEHGFVVTFDDITELVTAQRNSAWADIARRIAHEIKNPLTPIQLSAERLRRKYRKEIQTDPQVFEQCTDTIVRQVGDIGRMVDEFSAFARMPSAALEPNELVAVVKESLVLQRASFSDIEFTLDVPEEPIVFSFDRRLVTQAVTNLVKNAREAIETRQQRQADPPPRIAISVSRNDETIHVDVTDNGIGLPKTDRQRLTEPYMTTREKGTGLGLAIVKRIMEEHGGELLLMDAPERFDGGQGACIRLSFPLTQEPAVTEISASA
ncbi:MAG: ATP-binding protein [Parvibaculaceae bacterium]